MALLLQSLRNALTTPWHIASNNEGNTSARDEKQITVVVLARRSGSTQAPILRRRVGEITSRTRKYRAEALYADALTLSVVYIRVTIRLSKLHESVNYEQIFAEF